MKRKDPANPDGVELTCASIDLSIEGREIMREFWIKSIARAMFEKYGMKDSDQTVVQSKSKP